MFSRGVICQAGTRQINQEFTAMAQRWYMTGFEEWACREAYHIVVLSDVPCHLWLRWSRNQPWKHDRAREFRGLAVMGDVYYCFNAYHDIEQLEAGDTLEHTFTVAPWFPWEIRYFYIWGQIATAHSPSQSPIFCRMVYFTLRNYSARPSHEDDTVQVSWNNIYRNPPNPPNQGYVGTAIFAANTMGSAIRFRDDFMPKCAEILSAFLWVNAWGFRPEPDIHAQISAEYAGSPTDFYDISWANFFVRYATRVGIVDWNNLPPFVDGQWYKSPSIIGTIQAAINHPDWNMASRLVIFFDDFAARTTPGGNTFKAFRLWWSGIFNPPLLEIEYNHWQIARRKVF